MRRREFTMLLAGATGVAGQNRFVAMHNFTLQNAVRRTFAGWIDRLIGASLTLVNHVYHGS